MLNHPIDLEKMTAEQAIEATIEMWTDMMAKLGENPFTYDRVVFKETWLWEHGYTEKGPFTTNIITGNCFLCEYAANNPKNEFVFCKCNRCPIRWPDNTLDFHFCKGSALDYRKAPIPDILAYLKDKKNWRENNGSSV